MDDIVALDSSELVTLLGEDPEKTNSNSFSLISEVKSRWAHYLAHGVKAETLRGYQDLYSCPLPSLKPLELNPELAAILSPDKLKSEKFHMSFQQDICYSPRSSFKFSS